LTDLASPETSVVRCCTTHPDWPTLAQHLVDEFPEVGIGDVVREIAHAKSAVEQVDLGESDALHTAELIARQQLMLLCGRSIDTARLDPERHAGRAG
jgi:hypothetical protein